MALKPLQIMHFSLYIQQSGNYDDSLKHLETLQDLNKEDYKIAMNKAIAAFYKTGQTTTDTLKQTLLAMKNQVLQPCCCRFAVEHFQGMLHQDVIV